ncbi:hypothetical protein QTG56_04720 [Rossellomorea sp. AcN35-11]|nr:hypothetical protein [Rossellomorea aquimaris]WJV30402.1 hypothetical protein QTG56_04720 [Rossellomorea sp. AcN35-11]
MKVLSSLMLMITLAFAFSFNGVLAEGNNFEELQKKYPNAIQMLSEDNEQEARELEEKVLEDMKKNPIK